MTDRVRKLEPHEERLAEAVMEWAEREYERTGRYPAPVRFFTHVGTIEVGRVVP